VAADNQCYICPVRPDKLVAGVFAADERAIQSAVHVASIFGKAVKIRYHASNRERLFETNYSSVGRRLTGPCQCRLNQSAVKDAKMCLA